MRIDDHQRRFVTAQLLVGQLDTQGQDQDPAIPGAFGEMLGRDQKSATKKRFSNSEVSIYRVTAVGAGIPGSLVSVLVFNAQDLKRMGDLRYTLTIIITLISGYFSQFPLLGVLISMASELLGTLVTTSNSGSTSSVTSIFITAPSNRATSLSLSP